MPRSDPPDRDTRPRPVGIEVGRIAGVPVAIHLSWLLIVALSIYVLWERFSGAGAPSGDALAAAVVTALAFFASVLAHELSHAIVARQLGVPVIGITLFMFGGVAQLSREPEDARDEFRIALAGPLVNITLAGGLTLLSRALPAGTLWAAVVAFVADFNALVALFNLLPGHPLDGGALLRAGVWQISGDRTTASRVSGRAGQGLAYLLIGYGVAGQVYDLVFGGIMTVLIGLFLLQAARAAVIAAEVRGRLSGITVGEVARPAGWEGHDGWTISQVVSRVVGTKDAGVVLDAAGQAVGVFGPDDLAEVPSSSWDHLTLGEVMRRTGGGWARAGELLLDVLDRFRTSPDGVLVVRDDGGAATGVLTGADVYSRLGESRPAALTGTG